MIPVLAARSISEKVAGSISPALAAFFSRMARRMARIWWRSRDLFLRLYSVRRSVCRIRFSAEYVLAIVRCYRIPHWSGGRQMLVGALAVGPLPLTPRPQHPHFLLGCDFPDLIGFGQGKALFGFAGIDVTA